MRVSELNKRKVRQFFEEVLNEGRLELIDELVAKDFIGRLACVASTLNGPDGVHRFVSHRRVTCPDVYIKIEDQIAEDDRVVTRWRATIRTPHAAAPGTAIRASPSCAGITIVRLLAGKQVDAHTQCAAPHVDGPQGTTDAELGLEHPLATDHRAVDAQLVVEDDQVGVHPGHNRALPIVDPQ